MRHHFVNLTLQNVSVFTYHMKFGAVFEADLKADPEML